MTETEFIVYCDDGTKLIGTYFLPTPDASTAADLIAGSLPLDAFITDSKRKIFLINSALAVPRQYYFKFCRYLAEQGFAAVTYDYRGIGGSKHTLVPGRHLKISDWGIQDINAVLGWVYKNLQPTHVTAIGHSCGGQLLGLAKNSYKIDAIISIASQSADWRYWPKPLRVRIWLLWYFILPLLALGRNMVPMKALGISTVNLPAGVAREWATWGRTKGYLFNEKHGMDLSGYRQLEVPYLAYAFSDDELAPPSAVEALLKHFPLADIHFRHVNPDQVGLRKIGHFGFFQEQMKDILWQELLAWLEPQIEEIERA